MPHEVLVRIHLLYLYSNENAASLVVQLILSANLSGHALSKLKNSASRRTQSSSLL